MRRYALPVLAAGVLIAGAVIARSFIAAKPEADKALTKFDGTWVITAVEISGNKIPEGDLQKAPSRVAIQGSHWLLKAPGREETGTFTVDESKEPGQMDVKPADGPNAGRTYKAIYQIEGDTMTVCYAAPGQDRPATFETKDRAGYWMNVYKREKPAK